MRNGSGLYYLLIFMVWIGCRSNDNLSNIPSIQWIGISKIIMDQGDLNQDSVLIQIAFEDGDGDLGYGSSDPRKDITVIDQRTGLVSDQFKIPDLPNSNGRSIKGDIQLRLYTTCCIFPNNIPPCTAPSQYPFDTIVYEVFLTDKAGNKSNRVISPPVILRCN